MICEMVSYSWIGTFHIPYIGSQFLERNIQKNVISRLLKFRIPFTREKKQVLVLGWTRYVCRKLVSVRGQYLPNAPLDFHELWICYYRPNYAHLHQSDRRVLIWFKRYLCLSAGLSRDSKKQCFAEKCTLMRGQYLKFEPLDISHIFIGYLKPSYAKYQWLDWENLVWFESYSCLSAGLSRDRKNTFWGIYF